MILVIKKKSKYDLLQELLFRPKKNPNMIATHFEFLFLFSFKRIWNKQKYQTLETQSSN